MMKLELTSLLLSIVLTAGAQCQGIKGNVFWMAGNQMPGPSKTATASQAVIRELHFYRVTTLQQTKQVNGFFTEVSTQFVTKVLTKDDGSFKVKLEPGEYTVFVKEDDGLFANAFDQNERINPVLVKKNNFAWLTITVDYKAAY